MDKIIIEAQPYLFKAGKKLTAIAIADPSVTIIEVGKTLGFLLAESCCERGKESAKIHLENVNWVRRTTETGTLKKQRKNSDFQVRSFSEVALYFHATGIFVAQDTTSKKYIPWPSVESYAVIFISKDQYDELHQEIERDAFDQLLESVKIVIEDAPDFSFAGDTLNGPPNYACATTSQLEYEILGV